ncbi:alpha/beta fold hydrolase [Cupriavidus pauculus]|uniref:Alpha/beta hydrolase n=1 Tax=Cupriavidus pauculus TaxID=82633 RepID=A0A2N5CDR7_9BURK|nr:alpha/beta hydrolase [Cupriavidus pauculus]PLQ00393.1 alpha/beta hydrolase [Cupriavidus pauculus]
MADDVLVSGQGPLTVVAVHGIQGTRAVWQPLAEQLGGLCTFVLPNLPGRASAPTPAGPHECTLQAYADVLRRVICTQVRGPFVLAGWSLGVSVALAYLAQARATSQPMPAELVLVSGTPQLNQVAWFPAVSSETALRDAIAARERRLGLREAADHQTVAWTWMSIRDTDQRAELRHVTCPTRVIHGSADDDCPLHHGAALAEGIPDAALHVLHGAGHNVFTQQTDEIADALRLYWRERNATSNKTYPRETA